LGSGAVDVSGTGAHKEKKLILTLSFRGEKNDGWRVCDSGPGEEMQGRQWQMASQCIIRKAPTGIPRKGGGGDRLATYSRDIQIGGGGRYYSGPVSIGGNSADKEMQGEDADSRKEGKKNESSEEKEENSKEGISSGFPKWEGLWWSKSLLEKEGDKTTGVGQRPGRIGRKGRQKPKPLNAMELLGEKTKDVTTGTKN